MGCIESKKTIEVITDSDIKLVCNLDVFGDKNEPERVSGGGSADDAITTTTTTTTTKKQKNKLKYDPRVTAKYELKGTMGEGSFTSVVWVENRQTKQPYAIKIFDAKEGREAFEAELTILRRVRSPFIIRLVEVFENVDKMYMVMELATGGSLMDRIMERGPCGEKEAIRVLKMVLEGVRYLHHLGITHRDLKPDNMLFYHPGADSKLMITDFGLAHARGTADATFMSTICGTPEYIAPEMVLWQAYTSAVDLWAVGVVAFIILRGDFPFYHVNRSKLYKKILRGSFSMDDEGWSKVTERAKEFISKLLEVDPQTRMTAAAALAHPWLRSHAHTSSRPSQDVTSGGDWSCKSSTHSSQSACSGSLRAGRGRKVTPGDLPEPRHHAHRT